MKDPELRFRNLFLFPCDNVQLCDFISVALKSPKRSPHTHDNTCYWHCSSTHLVKNMTEGQDGVIRTGVFVVWKLIAEVNFNFLAITSQPEEITRSCSPTFGHFRFLRLRSAVHQYHPLTFFIFFYIYLSLVLTDNDYLLLLKYLSSSWKHLCISNCLL